MMEMVLIPVIAVVVVILLIVFFRFFPIGLWILSLIHI